MASIELTISISYFMHAKRTVFAFLYPFYFSAIILLRIFLLSVTRYFIYTISFKLNGDF